MKLRQIDPIGSYKPRWSRNHFASYQLVFIIGFIALVDYSFWDFAFFIFCRIRDRPHRKFVFYLLTKDRKLIIEIKEEKSKRLQWFLISWHTKSVSQIGTLCDLLQSTRRISPKFANFPGLAVCQDRRNHCIVISPSKFS